MQVIARLVLRLASFVFSCLLPFHLGNDLPLEDVDELPARMAVWGACTPGGYSTVRIRLSLPSMPSMVAHHSGLEAEVRLAGDAVDILKDGGVPDPAYNKRLLTYMNEAAETGLFVSV